MILPQDKSAWNIIEYSCWLPNLVHLWHLRWSSSCSLIKWLQTGCLVEVFDKKVCSGNIIAWQGLEESLHDRSQGEW